MSATIQTMFTRSDSVHLDKSNLCVNWDAKISIGMQRGDFNLHPNSICILGWDESGLEWVGRGQVKHRQWASREATQCLLLTPGLLICVAAKTTIQTRTMTNGNDKGKYNDNDLDIDDNRDNGLWRHSMVTALPSMQWSNFSLFSILSVTRRSRSDSVSQSVSQSVTLLNRDDWCDPGEWRYLLRTLLF